MEPLQGESPVLGYCHAHGPQTEAVHVNLPDHVAKYCLTCYAEWLRSNLSTLTEKPQ